MGTGPLQELDRDGITSEWLVTSLKNSLSEGRVVRMKTVGMESIGGRSNEIILSFLPHRWLGHPDTLSTTGYITYTSRKHNMRG